MKHLCPKFNTQHLFSVLFWGFVGVFPIFPHNCWITHLMVTHCPLGNTFIFLYYEVLLPLKLAAKPPLISVFMGLETYVGILQLLVPPFHS